MGAAKNGEDVGTMAQNEEPHEAPIAKQMTKGGNTQHMTMVEELTKTKCKHVPKEC